MRIKHLCVTVCISVFILTAISVLHTETLTNGSNFRDGEIILQYRNSTEFRRVVEIAAEHGASVVYRSFYANFVTVKIEEGEDLWRKIEEFVSYDEIDFAEPNAIVRIF